jgi:hypothetical protein
MDQETIQKIAAEVVRLLPSYAWVLLLVQAGIMAAAAAAGAFFGEYLKTRGKSRRDVVMLSPVGVAQRNTGAIFIMSGRLDLMVGMPRTPRSSSS